LVPADFDRWLKLGGISKRRKSSTKDQRIHVADAGNFPGRQTGEYLDSPRPGKSPEKSAIQALQGWSDPAMKSDATLVRVRSNIEFHSTNLGSAIVVAACVCKRIWVRVSSQEANHFQRPPRLCVSQVMPVARPRASEADSSLTNPSTIIRGIPNYRHLI
jgi:hypothetical protein